MLEQFESIVYTAHVPRFYFYSVELELLNNSGFLPRQAIYLVMAAVCLRLDLLLSIYFIRNSIKVRFNVWKYLKKFADYILKFNCITYPFIYDAQLNLFLEYTYNSFTM